MKAETTETAKATDKKINSIEQTPEKAKVRTDINTLVLQLLLYRESNNNPLKIVDVLSLAAEEWYFEHGLSNAIKNNPFLNKKPEFTFSSVEMKLRTAAKSLLNMPVNATLVGDCTLDKYLKYETLYRKNGHGEINLSMPRTSPINFDLIWADYCISANVAMLEGYVLMMKNNVKFLEEGLVGITINLHARPQNDKAYAKRFKQYSNKKTPYEAIKDTIAKMLKIHKVNNVNLIYDVVYAGGESKHSTMLTLFYSVNVPKKVIKPIVENRRDFDRDLKMSRYQLASRIIRTRKWNVPRQGQKSTTSTTAYAKKKIASPEQKRLDNAVSKYEKIWDMLSKEKKEKLATKYGVSFESFRSRVACRHGKFKAKKEAKVNQKMAA